MSEKVEQSIYSVLQSSCQRFGSSVAFHRDDGKSLTYQELLDNVNAIIAYLIKNGIKASGKRRVALVMPNGPEMSVSLLAISSVATAIPLNPSYTYDEYLSYFQLSGAEYLLVSELDSPAVSAAHAAGVSLLCYDKRLAPEFTSPAHFERSLSGDIAFLMLTSGSTGRSKIVPLTHRNLCDSASFVASSLHLVPGDLCLSMWEQFHIGGVVDLLLAPLMVGSQVISAGSFNANNFFELLNQFKPTWFQGVPTTLRELCFLAKKHNYQVNGTSLRFMRSVAAPLPESLLHEIEHLFGVPVIRTFGMTEASPLITSTNFETKPEKVRTVGRPYGPEVQIHNASGVSLPYDTEGLIAIRGANVFSGYEGDDTANIESFRNGWFYTGDTGYFDADGDFYITGRVKEMINRGGEKVAPKEIDDVLLKYPAISEAASFSLPHKTLGEEIGVGIVLKSGYEANTEEIRKFAALYLADFKIPTKFIYLDYLPRCPVGKIRRQEIASLYSDQKFPDRNIIHPINSLEEILLIIWKEELDLNDLSVDDDFSEIGGDSLSSLRIILSTQNLFNIKISADRAKHFLSVREMAVSLLEMGIGHDVADKLYEKIKADSLNSRRAEKTHLMESVTDKISRFDEISSQVLYECNSIFEFDTYRHAIENISTPSEMRGFFKSPPSFIRRVWKGLLDGLSLNSMIMIGYKRFQMKSEFNKAVRQADNPLLWKRARIGTHVDLFSDGSGIENEKILIVGFSSRGMRLTAPTYQILSALSPFSVDLILLRDANRNHYEEGIPEVGDSPEAVVEWVKDYLRDKKYKKVIALGTSSGGLIALYATLKNEWQNVLVCGCDRLSEHKAYRDLLIPLIDQSEQTDIVCAFSEKNDRDRDASIQLKELIKTVQVSPDNRFKEHALLYMLHQKGELKSFLTAHLRLD